MKRTVIILIMLSAMVLSAKNYEKEFRPKKKMIEFGFDNVTVTDIIYYDGKDIIVSSNRDDIIYTEEKHYLGIAAPKKAKISLKLPENLHYQTAYDEGRLYFDKDMVTLNSSDPSKIELNGSTMVVYDDENVITLYRDGELHIDTNEDEIYIKKDGFWKREAWHNGEYEVDEDMDTFWGRALAAVIGVAVRTVMNAVGDNPAEVAVTVLKENNWRSNVESVMDNIPKDKVKLSGNRYERSENYVFAPGNINAISVENFNGSIDIQGESDGNIEVSIVISSEQEESLDNVEIITEEGKTLKLISKALIKNPRCSIKYEISMPKKVELSVIESSNGKIQIYNCDGNAELETTNGGIEIKKCTGNLSLKTSNGSIGLYDISGNADARTSNGRIEADNINGQLSALTSNGKIEVLKCSFIKELITSDASIYAEIDEIAKYTQVITSNGSIKVMIPVSGSYDIHAKTSNGAIDTHGISISDLDKRKNKLKGEYNGGGNLLDLETSNAGIDIYKQKL